MERDGNGGGAGEATNAQTLTITFLRHEGTIDVQVQNMTIDLALACLAQARSAFEVQAINAHKSQVQVGRGMPGKPRVV